MLHLFKYTLLGVSGAARAWNKMPGATVKVAEHCKLATGTSANITLPPNQPQHTLPADLATGVDGDASSEACHWQLSITSRTLPDCHHQAAQHCNPKVMSPALFPHLRRKSGASSFLWNPSRCPEYKMNKVGKVIREHWSIFQEFGVVSEGQSCFTKERQPCVYSYRWLPGTQQVNWRARREIWHKQVYLWVLFYRRTYQVGLISEFLTHL